MFLSLGNHYWRGSICTLYEVSNQRYQLTAENSLKTPSRPPLSKELWFSEDPEVGKNLVFKDVSFTIGYFTVEHSFINVF
jgi:hypothetical protein